MVLFVIVALRAGVRGGPLAFEPAEVRHILMAPVDRRDSMNGPARAHLRHSAFLGMTVGAAAGLVALRRLPGTPVGWVVAGAAFGAFTGVFASAVAMIAAGARTPRWVGDVIAFPLLLWAAADAYWQQPISPFSWLGSLAVAPLGLRWTAGLGLATVAATAFVGVSLVSRCSIESAERRSRLIGQLRFAATVQDVRTVMVLQRQLAQEHPRNRPIIRLKGKRRSFTRKGQPATGVMTRRCWHNLLRWPLFRFVRLLVMTALLSALLCGLWQWTAALVVPAGLLMWLMAIDLLEALAQEADHPSTLQSVPRVPGWTKVRLLVLPAMLLFILIAVAGVPAIMFGPAEAVAALFIPMVVSATVLAIGGGALVVTRHGAPTGPGVQTPEVAGILTAWHAFLPPLLAIAGLAPLVVAKLNFDDTGSVTDMLKAMNPWWYGILALGSWSIAWIRYGSEIQANIAAAQQAQQAHAAPSSPSPITPDRTIPTKEKSGASTTKKTSNKSKKKTKGKK